MLLGITHQLVLRDRLRTCLIAQRGGLGILSCWFCAKSQADSSPTSTQPPDCRRV